MSNKKHIDDEEFDDIEPIDPEDETLDDIDLEIVENDDEDAEADDEDEADEEPTPKKKRKREPSKDEKAASAFKKLTSEDDEYRPGISLRTILGGDILQGKWFRKNFWFICMVALMCIFYVSNRYSCQQAIIETDRLMDTLADRRYKALTAESQVKEYSRRSVVESALQDTTLRPVVKPILVIPVDSPDSASTAQ